MKKRSTILVISMLIFLIGLGIFTYYMCDKEYSTRLRNYESQLDYIETHPNIDTDNFKIYYPAKSSAIESYGRVLDKIFILQWAFPIIIMILSSYSFYKSLHSGFIMNISFRTSYSKYIRNSVLKSWLKAIMVFIIPHILMFLVCFWYSGFKLFDANLSYMAQIFNYNVPLLLSFFVYLIIYALFCCNLGLIFSEKNRKYMVNIVLVAIVYIVLAIFLELGCGTIINNLATQNSIFIPYSISTTFLSVFNIFPYYYIGIFAQHWVTLLIIFVLFVITTCLVYLIYSDKERVMIESEN